MVETLALEAETRPWSLAALADETEFDRHVETTATAIADRFTLKVHLNVAARREAFADWIDRLRAHDRRPIDYRAFVGVCADLIASLAARRVVSYSPMIRDPRDRMVETVLKYPDEVTALALGAAIYGLAVERLTGEAPGEPLSALVIENTAANLKRHPEAALRFRELLKLSTPWT